MYFLKNFVILILGMLLCAGCFNESKSSGEEVTEFLEFYEQLSKLLGELDSEGVALSDLEKEYIRQRIDLFIIPYMYGPDTYRNCITDSQIDDFRDLIARISDQIDLRIHHDLKAFWGKRHDLPGVALVNTDEGYYSQVVPPSYPLLRELFESSSVEKFIFSNAERVVLSTEIPNKAKFIQKFEEANRGYYELQIVSLEDVDRAVKNQIE